MGLLTGMAHVAARLNLLDPLDGAWPNAGGVSRLTSRFVDSGPPSLDSRAMDGSMDFGLAVRAHGALTRRLEELVNGRAQPKMTVDALRHCDSGRLGRWLHGVGSEAYGHLPSFQRLTWAHRRLHLDAAEVVRLYRRGLVADARAMLVSGLYARHAKQVRDLLTVVFLDHGGRLSVESHRLIEGAPAATARPRAAERDSIRV
jgi:Chemoreceptor zinc-binding domain